MNSIITSFSRNLVLVVCVLIAAQAWGQKVKAMSQGDTVIKRDTMRIVETMPEFPGGEAALFKFIGENMKYPSKARDAGIQGIVYLQFIIDSTGHVDTNNVVVLNEVDPLLAAEAIRVVKSMPQWKPGTQQGIPVNVFFKFPMRFTLQKTGNHAKDLIDWCL